MKTMSFRNFMKTRNLKNNTMNESDLERNYIYPTYSRDSKLYSDEGFVNIDIGSMGGSRWTCFIIKDNKSY